MQKAIGGRSQVCVLRAAGVFEEASGPSGAATPSEVPSSSEEVVSGCSSFF